MDQWKVKQKIRARLSDFGFTWQFSVDDFRSKYAGSALGAAWAFIQPMITILLYWFVFQIGFKSQPVEDFPFILWLAAGLVPWFFISDAVSSAAGSLVEYSYLVKKVLFNIYILPAAKMLSVFFVQVFLLVVAMVLFGAYGYYPDWYYLQLPYYILYMFLFVAGFGYLTAAAFVFFRDVMQMIEVLIQFVFWATPIVWDIQIMDPAIQRILKLNPVYYIISGFRNSLIHKVWFWESGYRAIYYWIVVILLFIAGIRVFQKCKVHFADVL